MAPLATPPRAGVEPCRVAPFAPSLTEHLPSEVTRAGTARSRVTLRLPSSWQWESEHDPLPLSGAQNQPLGSEEVTLVCDRVSRVWKILPPRTA